ncbi:platelet binding protein GspB-like isoform X2 [Haliotis rufescens]|uniref:platelet binding protein GspB-like isoform X2 n=1 Tax=Haliotis rufescens TaxID=6454 RepID=UPI00201E7ACB|nr:platelet binding protein GspB-like isoform X2 [Haliotis rufescens]
MSVSPALTNNMRTKWRGSLFLVTWIILQVTVLCPTVSGLRHKTACYTFMLMVDPPCAATEMLLPTMFTLGVSSDVTCHSEITGTSLKQKGPDEIRRCCQQRENDAVTDYCLPAMKNQLPGHYFLDFVNTCTAATRCQLSSPGSKVEHTDGEDYVTFTFECVHKDTVLHIQRDSTHTGQEVYLYNDQHDGDAHANCLAYSHECTSHVIIQLVATRVVSAACSVDFTDGDVSTKVDCMNPPASRNCSSVMFESKSNYVNMSIFMTVDPGRQEKEFLWLLAKADTGENITVVCGANISSDVSLNCPTSASTTPSTTTSTTSTSASSTSTSASTTSTSASTTSTSASTTTTSTTSTTTTNVAATTATTTTTQTSKNASSKDTPVAVTCEPCNTLPITLGVSVAVLIVGFVSGWIMSRCFCQRQTRKNGADVYNTTSSMEEEHTYSTVRPTSAATYANTSYEYHNQ